MSAAPECRIAGRTAAVAGSVDVAGCVRKQRRCRVDELDRDDCL